MLRMTLGDRGEGRAHGLGRRDVALESQRTRADLARDRLNLGEPAPEQHDGVAIRRKPPRQRAPKPCASARDHDCLRTTPTSSKPTCQCDVTIVAYSFAWRATAIYILRPANRFARHHFSGSLAPHPPYNCRDVRLACLPTHANQLLRLRRG